MRRLTIISWLIALALIYFIIRQELAPPPRLGVCSSNLIYETCVVLGTDFNGLPAERVEKQLQPFGFVVLSAIVLGAAAIKIKR